MPFASEPLSYRDLVCIFAAIPYRSDAGTLFLLHRLLSIKIEKGNIYETLSEDSGHNNCSYMLVLGSYLYTHDEEGDQI